MISPRNFCLSIANSFLTCFLKSFDVCFLFLERMCSFGGRPACFHLKNASLRFFICNLTLGDNLNPGPLSLVTTDGTPFLADRSSTSVIISTRFSTVLLFRFGYFKSSLNISLSQFSKLILSQRNLIFFLCFDFAGSTTDATEALSVNDRCTCEDVLHRIKSFTVDWPVIKNVVQLRWCLSSMGKESMAGNQNSVD